MKKKILVIDDDKDTLETIKKILVKNNYEVKILEEPKKCIEFIKKTRPDLVLLDILMPEILGTDLSEIIKTEFCNLPVVFLTIVPKEEIDVKRVDGYIRKPFYIKDLLKLVKKVLNKKSANR